MPDDIDFPDLHQSALDEETLRQYARDLEQLADIHDVSVKGGSREYASDAQLTLAEGLNLLCDGDVRGLQIRYAWDDELWWDTLMAKDGAIEITRVQPPEEVR